MSTEIESYKLIETRTYCVRTEYFSVNPNEVSNYINYLYKTHGNENVLEISSKRSSKTISVIRCVYKTLSTEETSVSKDEHFSAD
jgi:hypothetical protein